MIMDCNDISGLSSRKALVAYGSETGNAQDVAEEVFRLCERLRFTTQLAALDSISLNDLLRHDPVIIVISTTGQGDLPANAQKFWRSLRSARLPVGCLSKLRFTSFGLGDSSYPQFNWAHKKISNRLLQLGAQIIFERAESDERHPEGIDGSFVPWVTQLRHQLLNQYPLPNSVEAIAEHVLLEPKWIIQQVAGEDDTACLISASEKSSPASAPQLSSSVIAVITANDRVTPVSHWQDVRHLSLRLEEYHGYSPGDTLTIYPENSSADIDQLLAICGWAHIADTSMMFVPTNKKHYNREPRSYPSVPVPQYANRPFTLRELLTTQLDIMSIPRRSFFSHLLHYTDDEFQRERLKEFTDPQFIDELFDYTTRPRRSILEVLEEFTTVNLPWQKICSIIPGMRGRQFSIASGGDLKSVLVPSVPDDLQGRVELLVAIVKYKTVIKRVRQGVCTRYIANLQPGQKIPVTLQKGGLSLKPADMEKPVIMVGPGTGVAPMRSLIYERLQLKKDRSRSTKDVASDILFFGCRSAKTDYFFKEEWQGMCEQGSLQTFAAFSRDQRHKVYVQDLLRQQRALVFKLLAEKGGIIFVSGSSGRMPQAVREALIEVFQEEGRMNRADAERYFTRLEKEGRYKQETW